MGGSYERRRVPHVLVTRRDVEVPADRQARRRTRIVGPRLSQGTQPLQLVGEMRAVNGSPVGHVQRPDPDAAACCGDRSCLGRWEAGLTGESSLYVVDPKQRQDGDAVPLGNSVYRCVIPERGELGAGKLLVG